MQILDNLSEFPSFTSHSPLSQLSPYFDDDEAGGNPLEIALPPTPSVSPYISASLDTAANATGNNRRRRTSSSLTYHDGLQTETDSSAVPQTETPSLTVPRRRSKRLVGTTFVATDVDRIATRFHTRKSARLRGQTPEQL
jgi:hypothetical protein